MHRETAETLAHAMVAGKSRERYFSASVERKQVAVSRRPGQFLVGRRHDAMKAHGGVAVVVVADVHGLVEGDGLAHVRRKFRCRPLFRIREGDMRLRGQLQPAKQKSYEDRPFHCIRFQIRLTFVCGCKVNIKI